MFQKKMIIAGAGGQGALRIGQMIAYAALDEGYEVEWLPSYGAEMRGGTANCNVTISDEAVHYPMVVEPDCLIVMNDLSLIKFEHAVCSDGIIILDSSMIKDKVTRQDLKTFYVPADTIAEEEGNVRGANMVLLGAYLAASDQLSLAAVGRVIEQSFTGPKAKYAESNKRLLQRGFDMVKQAE